LSPGVGRKATPAWTNGAALSFCQSSQSIAKKNPRGRPEALCLQPKECKPDGRLTKNAEKASQSGYGRERIWAPEQSGF
jgi:hypothetical protein